MWYLLHITSLPPQMVLLPAISTLINTRTTARNLVKLHQPLVNWYQLLTPYGGSAILLVCGSCLAVFSHRVAGSLVRALDSWHHGCKFNSWLPQLILGWVTIFWQANHLSISPSHPGQLSLLPSAEQETSTCQIVVMGVVSVLLERNPKI